MRQVGTVETISFPLSTAAVGRPQQHVGVAMVVLTTLAMTACKEEVELPSVWAPVPVVVDGIDDEWAGQLTEFEQYDASLGLRNDDRFLYVSQEFLQVTSRRDSRHEAISLPLDPADLPLKSAEVFFLDWLRGCFVVPMRYDQEGRRRGRSWSATVRSHPRRWRRG